MYGQNTVGLFFQKEQFNLILNRIHCKIFWKIGFQCKKHQTYH